MKFKLMLIFVVFLVLASLCISRPKISSDPICPGVTPNENGHVFDSVDEAWFCCMCPAGTYVAQTCRKSDHSSTVCEPCPFDEDPENQFYMDHGPHLEKSCKKSISKCEDGFRRIAGTTLHDARCKKDDSNSSAYNGTSLPLSLLLGILGITLYAVESFTSIIS